MACNFYAAMNRSRRDLLPPCVSFLSATVLVALALTGPACAQAAPRAEQRDPPLTFEAGQMRIDGKRKVRVLSGGVELTRGGFVLKAAEVEVRDAGAGQVAVALSGSGQTAQFRQKREGVDETVEGQADRIEYDTSSTVVRLIGKAVMRRFRGTVLSEEVTGQTITYDQERETFEVQGGHRVKGTVSPTGSPRVTGEIR